MTKKFKAAFLGAGNMGSALIQGALTAGIIQRNNIKVFDIDRNRLKKLAGQYKVTASFSNLEAIQESDFIFICVKPQQIKDLMAELKKNITPKQCLISIVAGIQTQTIEKYFSFPVPVIRVMPNTPALIQNGMTVITKGRFATRAHLQFAKDFFSSVGKVVILAEKYFDVVTAVSGSGPAYLFYLAESLQRAGQQLGLSKSISDLLCKQTLMGSGMMLDNSSSPIELRRKVTSPGGTTEAAIRYLEKNNWSDIFVEAVKKAKNRSRELSLSR